MLDKKTILLRPLDFQPVIYQGQQMWLLRDPLQLSDRQLFMPEGMTPLLALLDGTRSMAEIHATLCTLAGATLPPEVTTDALARLDDALLLDNERSAQARQEQLDVYRAQPFRPPALAGHGYPAESEALATYLESFGSGQRSGSWAGRGIVSPHIDYDRGGQVYAKIWGEARQAILDAELVIILGTDHYGGMGTMTLTHQPYATPYGVLPADPAAIETMAVALGKASAFADELHHRQEHSVELSAVWLHHVFYKAGREPCPMVPVLVGSFHHFLGNGRHPTKDPRFERFLQTLSKIASERRVLTVASVDLAHVGPAFGDQFMMDQPRRDSLAHADKGLMAAAATGDAAAWYDQIASVGDRNRICGFSPTYFLLRHLGLTTGRQVAYEQCPADQQDASFVSICGLLID